MSRAFPHLSITGVDLVPPPIDPEQMPDNFQAEVDDINLGLTHFYGRFDLVHMRCVYPGLKGRPFTYSGPRFPLPLFGLFSSSWVIHYDSHSYNHRLSKDSTRGPKMPETGRNSISSRQRAWEFGRTKTYIYPSGKRWQSRGFLVPEVDIWYEISYPFFVCKHRPHHAQGHVNTSRFFPSNLLRHL